MSEHAFCKCVKAMTNKFGRCSRCGRDVPVEKVEQTASPSHDVLRVGISAVSRQQGKTIQKGKL